MLARRRVRARALLLAPQGSVVWLSSVAQLLQKSIASTMRPILVAHLSSSRPPH